ncbi:hypothetical protein BLS_005282 [Venturia inaequalis]|uniref:Uncharacterized protein n=1 Tax=Venturia inaequalis TaxID=5025 RepID=A0A8H3YUY6_VENIN|nr:hypothetical protein EG328_003761 [Venturia inaequalis]KAE9977440.1 hypothetical protein EG327_007741 [Venturia inaequalis]KAE9982881.1 hypothetical protein BLS_005282 [Venturia inaequalis]
MASPNGDNYFESAAGGACAHFLSPIDSFGFGDRSWQETENDETNTPYVLSPFLGNDDSDLTTEFPQVNFFGLDPHVPLAEQSVFPRATNHAEQYTQPAVLTGSLASILGSTPCEPASQTWEFGGGTISDRLFQSSVDPITLVPVAQPTRSPNAGMPRVLDLQFAHLHTAPGQDIEQEKSDLILKVQNGSNIQPMVADDATNGVEALRQCLLACQTQGQRGLSSHEIQNLLVRGQVGDSETVEGNPKTKEGCITERLTPDHLQTALNRYSLQTGISFRLGLVRATHYTLDFEVSMHSDPPTNLSRGNQVIIWMYQELVNFNPFTKFYDHCLWAAITPSTTAPKNYAQALKSPEPKANEVQKPVDHQLLHPGRRSTISSQTGTPSSSASSSSSEPKHCCGKMWTSKNSYK